MSPSTPRPRSRCLRLASFAVLAGGSYLVALNGCGTGEVGAPYVFGPPDCGDTPEQLMGCVDLARLQETLRFLAKPRPPGSEHHQASQDYCADQLEQLGYDVERHSYGSGVNVIGTLLGTTASSERILLSAHYDHIEGCDGADDNASGTAGVIEAARVLASRTYPKTLVVACWDEEELGLVGSRAYAQRALDSEEDIRSSVVFEMIGYRSTEPDSQVIPDGLALLFSEAADEIASNGNRADFILTVSNESAKGSLQRFGVAAEIAGVPHVALELTDSQATAVVFGDLRRSDHAPFWDAGFPALLITDSANFRNANYHCIDGADTIETIDFEFAVQVTQAAVGTVANLLEES